MKPERQPATGMLLRHDRPPAAVVVARYADLRSLISRPIVATRLSRSVVIYTAEEPAGLPWNPVATWLANELGCGLGLDEFLHGPAVVFGCLNPAGEWDGLEYDCPIEVRRMLEKEEDDHVDFQPQGLLFSR